MAVDDSYTKLLLHFDGTNASTTFTDEAGNAMTANGNAQLSTSVKKFGTASGYFDGSGDTVTAADSADWDFGTDPFTIDCWHYSSGTTNSLRYVSAGVNSGSGDCWFFGRYVGAGSINFGGYTSTDGWQEWGFGSLAFSDNTWIHSAVVRNGTHMYFFWNGGLVQDQTISATMSFTGGSSGLMIGARSTGGPIEYWNGYIDELRISKGIARWTSAFTPPSAPYAPSVTGNFFQLFRDSSGR